MSDKKKWLWICLILMGFLLGTTGQTVHAAVKQAEITTTSKQGDLTVLFTFDKEVVDIAFISPSGAKKTAGDSDVEYSAGDLWSTYRIHDAVAGKWSVEYDLGANTGIDYSIIEDDYGLWLQYFTPGEIAEDRLPVTFEADYESEDVYYRYEIYAVSTTDSEEISLVSDGSAKANEEKEAEMNLSHLSSDTYVFRLEVYYQDGDVELFDSLQTEEISYTNPNEPESIENYKVLIDTDGFLCTVDWSDYAGWGDDAYRLNAEADGESIYSGKLERNVTESSFTFSSEVKSLTLKLSYKRNNMWSAATVKTIDLEQENLSNASGEITSSGQLGLAYKVAKERPLHVNINGEEGDYQVKEEGTLFFDLNEGNNTVYAEMETDNLVYYVVDTNVYCDFLPPEIKLYENLDGKTFYTDSAVILGKITGGDTLRIDGNVVEPDENGDFSCEVKLSLGENVVELEAEDANGNLVKRVLTLYKDTNMVNGVEAKKGWLTFLPLFVSLFVSAVIILLSVLFLKKKDKTEKKKRRGLLVVWDVCIGLAEGICIWQFVSRYLFGNSMAYLELAEKSAAEAARYLRMERIFGIASGAGLLLLFISILVTVLVFRHGKKKQAEQEETR